MVVKDLDVFQQVIEKVAARLTTEGREKVDRFLKKEIAPELQQKWRGNLEESQQSLAEDIQIFDSDEAAAVVGTQNEVLKWLEWGTEPHVITPNEAEALQWFNDNGNPVFAVRVEHPGFEPYAHLRTAMDTMRRKYSR